MLLPVHTVHGLQNSNASLSQWDCSFLFYCSLPLFSLCRILLLPPSPEGTGFRASTPPSFVCSTSPLIRISLSSFSSPQKLQTLPHYHLHYHLYHCPLMHCFHLVGVHLIVPYLSLLSYLSHPSYRFSFSVGSMLSFSFRSASYSFLYGLFCLPIFFCSSVFAFQPVVSSIPSFPFHVGSPDVCHTEAFLFSSPPPLLHFFFF
mmetsp:Transcript_5894/g.7239  ORF Transcript_5894/g.7239 Transcript_5894/m.7239 type:complete len:203 (-) Transcript_5894:135-743(-)